MPIPSLPAGLPRSSRMVVANRLHSAAIHLLRRARAVDRQSGISPERLSVLSVLVFAGPQTMSDLARIEMVSRPAITRLAKSLEQGGLVRRRSDRADRRRVQLRATAKGRALMERARALRVARVAEELEGLSQRELATLREAASILERHR
jgi:DNA-binding MarR family transcriptional regulator